MRIQRYTHHGCFFLKATIRVLGKLLPAILLMLNLVFCQEKQLIGDYESSEMESSALKIAVGRSLLGLRKAGKFPSSSMLEKEAEEAENHLHITFHHEVKVSNEYGVWFYVVCVVAALFLSSVIYCCKTYINWPCLNRKSEKFELR